MYEIPRAKDSTGNMEHCAQSRISKTELSIHCDCTISVSLISTGCLNCCPWEILEVNPAHNHAFVVTIWDKLVSVTGNGRTALHTAQYRTKEIGNQASSPEGESATPSGGHDLTLI